MYRSPRLSDRVARVLAFVVVAIMAVFLVVYTAHKATGRVPALVLDFLHINTELAFASWFNAGLLLVVAILSGLLASSEQGRVRTAWSVVALAAAYLSLDEATELHEKAGRLIAKVPALDIGTFHWVVPGAVVASAGVVLLLWATSPLDDSVRRRLGLALTGYLTGALGVELVTGLLIRTFSDVWVVVAVVQPALVVVEESLEMFACIYAIRALLAHIEDHWEARPRLVEAGVTAPRRR